MLGPSFDLYFVSFLVLQLSRWGKRELVALLFCVLKAMLLLSFLLLPRGAMGWSVVCDCGISWSNHITFSFVSCSIKYLFDFTPFFTNVVLVKSSICLIKLDQTLPKTYSETGDYKSLSVVTMTCSYCKPSVNFICTITKKKECCKIIIHA